LLQEGEGEERTVVKSRGEVSGYLFYACAGSTRGTFSNY